MVTSTSMSALKAELETYKRELPRLLAQEGMYALVSGDEVLGVYETYADAMAEGYERVGLKPFLVKRIETVESIQFFTREIA